MIATYDIGAERLEAKMLQLAYCQTSFLPKSKDINVHMKTTFFQSDISDFFFFCVFPVYLRKKRKALQYMCLVNKWPCSTVMHRKHRKNMIHILKPGEYKHQMKMAKPDKMQESFV